MKKFEFQKKIENGLGDFQEKKPENEREGGKRFDQKKDREQTPNSANQWQSARISGLAINRVDSHFF